VTVGQSPAEKSDPLVRHRAFGEIYGFISGGRIGTYPLALVEFLFPYHQGHENRPTHDEFHRGVFFSFFPHSPMAALG
jgi:hypothetical protein